MSTTENPESIIKKLSEFSNACRKAYLKLTHQRYEIYRELLESVDHPAAETLHKRLLLKIPTMSLDTVYRTLATFERHGLISRVQTVESQARFEATSSQHHHLICSVCKNIIDFQWKHFDETALPPEVVEWGIANDKHIVIYGVCNKCLYTGNNP